MSRTRSRLLSALLPCVAAGLLSLGGAQPGLAEPPGKGDAPPPEQEISNNLGLTLKVIPAGKFHMGSPETEKQRSDDEGPQREVMLTQAFYLGVYPVTQEEYRRVTGKNPS